MSGRTVEGSGIGSGSGPDHTVRVGGRFDRLWRWGRWGLLAVLLLSFATFVLRFFPLPGSTDLLVRDIRAGRTGTVQVDSRGDDVRVRWHTGILTEREYRYLPKDPGGEVMNEVIAVVKRQAGPRADHVAFQYYDASYGTGGLSVLWPTTYVFFTPWGWLIAASVLVGLVVLWRALWVERHRRASGPAWALASLVTGFGFFAYLWAEPGGGPPAREGGPGPAPHPARAWVLTLCTVVALVASGVLLRLVAGL